MADQNVCLNCGSTNIEIGPPFHCINCGTTIPGATCDVCGRPNVAPIHRRSLQQDIACDGTEPYSAGGNPIPRLRRPLEEAPAGV